MSRLDKAARVKFKKTHQLQEAIFKKRREEEEVARAAL